MRWLASGVVVVSVLLAGACGNEPGTASSAGGASAWCGSLDAMLADFDAIRRGDFARTRTEIDAQVRRSVRSLELAPPAFATADRIGRRALVDEACGSDLGERYAAVLAP